jgi:hypothetical protein
MHAAYQEVGFYRAAAEICGTTDKTVKRVVEATRRREALGNGGEATVAHNYDPVRTIVAERVARTSGRISDLRPVDKDLRRLPLAPSRRSKPAMPN